MDFALIYLVAGISSRFGGKSKSFAKITPNQTLIEYSLHQALPAGFTKIIFVVGEKTEKQFKEKFGTNYQGKSVNYCYQQYNSNERNKPWGTADALCSTKNVLDCPFVVCNGDDLYGEDTFKKLITHLKENNEEATIGYKLEKVIPTSGKVNRGIFELDKENYITGIKEIFGMEKNTIEKMDLSNDLLCSMNIFAMHPRTLNLLYEKTEKFKEENKNNKEVEALIQIEISELIKENKIKMKLYPTDETWLGITNPEDENYLKESLKKLENKSV